MVSLFSQAWLAIPQLVLQADWQEVWHSPQPPFLAHHRRVPEVERGDVVLQPPLDPRRAADNHAVIDAHTAYAQSALALPAGIDATLAIANMGEGRATVTFTGYDAHGEETGTSSSALGYFTMMLKRKRSICASGSG